MSAGACVYSSDLWHRAAAAFILKITYGYEVLEEVGELYFFEAM